MTDERQSIIFRIDGVMGQPRPRFTTVNGLPKAYTSTEATIYREQAAFAFSTAARRSRISTPVNADPRGIEVQICASMSCPKSMTKKQREMADRKSMRPTKKPDADNIAKIILDSLNGIAWNDDASVTTLAVTKCYTSESDHVDVMVRWFPVE